MDETRFDELLKEHTKTRWKRADAEQAARKTTRELNLILHHQWDLLGRLAAVAKGAGQDAALRIPWEDIRCQQGIWMTNPGSSEWMAATEFVFLAKVLGRDVEVLIHGIAKTIHPDDELEWLSLIPEKKPEGADA